MVDLEQRLKRGGLDLILARIDEKKPSFSIRKIRRSDLITFFFNLDQLFRSGVPLLECLTDLHDSMDDAQFRRIIADMVEAIESGATLSHATAQHPQAFNPIFVSLIHAGEESGRLPEVFEHLTT